MPGPVPRTAPRSFPRGRRESFNRPGEGAVPVGLEGPEVNIAGSSDAQETWTVSGLLGRLGNLLDEQPDLQELTLRAEITNWTRARSGHCYFSLKDDQAQVRCVMFQGEARHLNFEPADGVAVRAQGSVTLYRPRGELQLRIRRLRADGVGALYEALERLRRRLEAEGLFDQDRKRPLPSHPRVVGVVTSKQGAVLHDIRTTLARRNPTVQILLAPSPVQGEGAEAGLVQALEALQRRPEVDCIIVARGGGSLEDLMAFNSEVVIRAVAGCRVPVVSAVGHETDVTLCDLAADERAPTPTAAAEIIAPALEDLLGELARFRQKLSQAMSREVNLRRERLEHLRSAPRLRHPRRRLEAEMQHLDSLVDSLRRGMGRGVQTRNETLGLLRRGLNQQHPRSRIQRSLDLLRERMARLQRGMVQRMQAARQDLEVLASTPTFREPLRLTASRQEGLQALRTSLLRAAWRGVSWQRERLDAARGRLEALSPLRVLERGYALVLDRAEVVSSVEGIRPGDRLEIRLRDGAVKTRVEEVEEAT